jgi:hypothetical protein
MVLLILGAKQTPEIARGLKGNELPLSPSTGCFAASGAILSITRLAARHRLGRLTRARLATARGWNRQVSLMFPLTCPRLTRPSLKRDRAHRGPIFVTNHLSPGAGIRRTNLRRALADAEQALARRGQARNRPPVLSACGFSHTHRCSYSRLTTLPRSSIRNSAGSLGQRARADKIGEMVRRSGKLGNRR